MELWQIAEAGLTISRRSQTFLYGTLLLIIDPSTSYRTSGRCRGRERFMVRSNIFEVNAVLSSPLIQATILHILCDARLCHI
jgi:hypothetical protein